jgi:hypothetical protein
LGVSLQQACSCAARSAKTACCTHTKTHRRPKTPRIENTYCCASTRYTQRHCCQAL